MLKKQTKWREVNNFGGKSISPLAKARILTYYKFNTSVNMGYIWEYACLSAHLKNMLLK